MLIEFKVENFRSLRELQTLSLVASKDKSFFETHTTTSGANATLRLLHSAVIYGANASGKSNLIKALQFMRAVVVGSAIDQTGQIFDRLRSFQLDTEKQTAETSFEITFIQEGVRYEYGFSMTPKRIVREYLLVYQASKPQRWFERHFDSQSGQDIYEFGPHLKGPKTVWKETTRSNALFLSIAVQLNSESLQPVFHWFLNDLVIFNELTPLGLQSSIEMLRKEAGRKQICDFLSAADISLSDIEVVTRKQPYQQLQVNVLEGKGRFQPVEIETHELRFSHVAESGKAVFGLEDESDGTRKLLFLIAPVLQILQKGAILVIDELDTSMHPLLIVELIKLFHSPQINTKGAQLIFTTHSSSLMEVPGLFRRDQIWLIHKSLNQASELVGLIEFSPRKHEAIERGYLTGRYGGLPFLKPLFGLDSHE